MTAPYLILQVPGKEEVSVEWRDVPYLLGITSLIPYQRIVFETECR